MIKIRTLEKTAVAGVIVLSTAAAFAASDKRMTVAEQKAPGMGSFYVQQLNESSDMMGEISLAKHALDLGFSKDAVYHIDQAQNFATQLQKKSPELAVSSTLRFNNKVYTFNNKYKDYLIPTVDDMFTVAEYDTKIKRNPKKDKIAEDQAGVGRYQLALDIRNVEGALSKSKELANDGKDLQARNELNNVYVGAVENSVVYDDPIWAVNDNLMVTNELIKEKDFRGARYALNKAGQELQTIRKTDKYKGDAKTLGTLQNDIAALHKTIRKDDPNMFIKAGDKISGLLKDVRGIGERHAAAQKNTIKQ